MTVPEYEHVYLTTRREQIGGRHKQLEARTQEENGGNFDCARGLCSDILCVHVRVSHSKS